MQNNTRTPSRPVSISSAMSYSTHRRSSASSSAASGAAAAFSSTRHYQQQPHERQLHRPQSSFSQRQPQPQASARSPPLSQHQMQPQYPVRPVGTAATATTAPRPQPRTSPPPTAQGAAAEALARCNRCMKPLVGTAGYFVLAGCRCMYCNGENSLERSAMACCFLWHALLRASPRPPFHAV
jgi:hypothetical protein